MGRLQDELNCSTAAVLPFSVCFTTVAVCLLPSQLHRRSWVVATFGRSPQHCQSVAHIPPQTVHVDAFPHAGKPAAELQMKCRSSCAHKRVVASRPWCPCCAAEGVRRCKANLGGGVGLVLPKEISGSCRFAKNGGVTKQLWQCGNVAK